MSRRYLAHGTSWTLAGMVGRHLLGYATVVAVLRWVDLSTYGAVVFLLSWLAVPAALAGQGLPAAATRFVSQHLARGENAQAGAIVSEIKWLVLIGAAALALAAPALHAALPADIAARVSVGEAALLCAALVILQPLLQVNQSAALGLKASRLRAWIGFLLPPALRLAFLLAVLPFATSASGLVAAYAIGWLAAFAISEALVGRRGLGFRRPLFGQVGRVGSLYRFAVPVMVSELLMLCVLQADKIFLGYLGDAATVGTYGVASRLAYLCIAPARAAAQAFAPVISEQWSAERLGALKRSYQGVAEVTLLATGVTVALLVVNLGWALRLIDPQLDTQATLAITQILAIGLLLTVLPGNQTQLYRMTGRPGLSVLNTAIVAALNLALNWILIRRYGAVGAAVATAVSLALGNLTGFVYLKLFYDFRIHPFGERYWISLATVLCVVSLGFLLADRPVLGTTSVLALAGAAVGVAYRGDVAALARAARRPA